MECVWVFLIVILILLWGVPRIREKIKPEPLFDSVYYINLAKRPKKRKQIETQIKPLKKLTGNIIRFKAVDGTRLLDIDPQIVNFQGIEDLNNPNKSFGLSLTKGAIGCAMSHKTIWEEVAETEKDLVLILEDDAVILPGFTQKISDIISELPDEWDILYLGSDQHTVEKYLSPHLAQPSRIYGLFGYVINWQGAKRLLKQCFPLRYQIDTELWLHFKNLKPVMAVPFVIGEKKRKSDIQIEKNVSL